jgi:hypothetical protein
MTESLVLLAVTRMLSGFCIAGIDGRGVWRRPVKPNGALLLGDVSYRDRVLMRPFDRVDLGIQRDVPEPPHVEDCRCDFLHPRPACTGHLDPAERAAFLAAHAEPSPSFLLNGERSLALFRPEKLAASFHLDGYSGRYEARIRLSEVGDERGLPCTDLRWRARGRTLVPPEGGVIKLTHQELVQHLGTDAIYLALGLARERDGHYTPLVVGVLPAVDYDVTVDPTRP